MKNLDTKIALFNSDTIEQLIWPETEEGIFAKKILFPLIKNGVQPYFNNVKTIMMALRVDDFILPITINDNDAEIDNSYVCSFYSYYIGYGLNNAVNIKNKYVQKCTKIILTNLGRFLRVGNIDKIVSINNWLFSTNLYPKLTESQILSVREFIKEKFPGHAIVFRSVNTLDQNSPLQALKNNRFKFIASRQIFITDTKEKKNFETRLFKSDLKFLDKTDYKLSNVEGDHEVEKVLSLYNSLYVDKYSKINPQPNEKFLKLLFENRSFNFKTLKKNNQIDGIVGYYSIYGVMSAPFFGYDANQPQEAGLYRLLSTVLTVEAKNQQQLFHQSSGASFYKSIRKATPTIEYSAVYTKHLSLTHRFFWKTLRFIMNYFGIYWMKKY